MTAARRFFFFFLLLAGGIFCVPGGGKGGPLALELGGEDLSRLAKGEVVVRIDRTREKKKEWVEAAILIDAPADSIWKTINDCAKAPEFIHGLKNCQVLQRDGAGDLIEHRLKISKLLPEVKYVFRAEYQESRRVDFRRISGDLKEFEGSWVLQNNGPGDRPTLVIYSVYLDAGPLLPQWGIQLILQEDLPEILLSLRKQVTASPKE